MKEDGCTYEHSEVKKARHAFARVRVSRSVVSDSSAAPWTIACQAPLSRGILQARILEWVAMPSSRGSSRPGDQTHISYVYCLGQAGFFFFNHWHHLGRACVQTVKWETEVCPLSRPGTPCRAGDERTHSHLRIRVRRHPAITLTSCLSHRK